MGQQSPRLTRLITIYETGAWASSKSIDSAMAGEMHIAMALSESLYMVALDSYPVV